VIHDPNTGDIHAARRGRGATRNGTPIRVSGIGALDRAVFGVGHSPRHPAAQYNATVAAVVSAGAQTRNYCCAALQLAYVADGRLDATWDPYLLDWDVAAGILLVEEAGGSAVPFVPGRLGPSADRLLAGNAGLVDALRPLLP
jgi:myo-inositol-1(or 4)-monophosphatase